MMPAACAYCIVFHDTGGFYTIWNMTLCMYIERGFWGFNAFTTKHFITTKILLGMNSRDTEENLCLCWNTDDWKKDQSRRLAGGHLGRKRYHFSRPQLATSRGCVHRSSWSGTLSWSAKTLSILQKLILLLLTLSFIRLTDQVQSIVVMFCVGDKVLRWQRGSNLNCVIIDGSISWIKHPCISGRSIWLLGVLSSLLCHILLTVALHTRSLLRDAWRTMQAGNNAMEVEVRYHDSLSVYHTSLTNSDLVLGHWFSSVAPGQ